MTNSPGDGWENPMEGSFQDDWAEAGEAGEDWHLYSLFRSPLGDLNELHDDVAKILQGNGSDDPVKNANTLLLYFSLSSAIFENKCAEIIYAELLDEEYQNSETRKLFHDGSWINQHRREELLEKTDLIDSALRGKMQQVRGVRNDLVHDPHGRFELNRRRIEDTVNASLEIVRELDKILDGRCMPSE